MNERIHNLLTLCMEANAKGIDITFDHNKSMITVHDLTTDGNTISFFIFLRLSGVDNDFIKTENYLKEVIDNAST